MVIFLVVLMLSAFSVIALMQLHANRRKRRAPVERRERYSPFVILLTVLLLLSNIVAESEVYHRMPFCLSLGLLAFHSILRKEIHIFMIMEILLSLYFLLCVFNQRILLPVEIFIIGVIILHITNSFLYIRDIYVKLRALKNVMKMGSVWDSLTNSIDAVYMCTLSSVTLLYYMAIILNGRAAQYVSIIFSFLLFLYLLAQAYRVLNSSVFVLWANHERRIVESMKLTHLEMCGETPGNDQLYRTIYDRVLECFEKEKPYLNAELSINDIAEKVYTNKLYISKAISQHTGRNFCQFVNYYRVLHSIEIFRKNPKLKIIEIAARSGFNSSVSYTAAFRLYMGEKPGEWCKRERALLEKQKNLVAQ